MENTVLKSCQALSRCCDTSLHIVFCGQQGSWDSWLSFSVELFLTIVCRKPWKSEARTPKSIRKIGGREETLQLFFKQSLHGSLRQLLWFLQGTDLDFFKSLCLAVLKIICCDMFKHILGINNEEIWSCNNQMECVTPFGLDLLWELHLIKSNGNFVYHAKKTPAMILTAIECVCRILLLLNICVYDIDPGDIRVSIFLYRKCDFDQMTCMLRFKFQKPKFSWLCCFVIYSPRRNCWDPCDVFVLADRELFFPWLRLSWFISLETSRLVLAAVHVNGKPNVFFFVVHYNLALCGILGNSHWNYH